MSIDVWLDSIDDCSNVVVKNLLEGTGAEALYLDYNEFEQESLVHIVVKHPAGFIYRSGWFSHNNNGISKKHIIEFSDKILSKPKRLVNFERNGRKC